MRRRFLIPDHAGDQREARSHPSSFVLFRILQGADFTAPGGLCGIPDERQKELRDSRLGIPGVHIVVSGFSTLSGTVKPFLFRSPSPKAT